MNYEQNPARIYEKSFATIRGLADFSRFPANLVSVAERIVHSCGMPDVAGQLRFSSYAAEAGLRSIRSGKPIFCDGRMTAGGIISNLIVSGNEVVSPRFTTELEERSKKRGITRTALAVEAWRKRLANSVVVIGNAPTALFRLLEMLDEGSALPALVLAFPVGFVGAAESKEELLRNPRGLEFLTLPGRRGGSAMAAAAVNALLIEASKSDVDADV